MKNSLSICIIAKNEEHNIERCLKSVYSIADEIILVDTGSTDKTKELSKKYNAKIYDFKWSDDYSKARNESLKYAKSDWILVLDADEELTEDAKKNLKPFLNSFDKSNISKQTVKTNSKAFQIPSNKRQVEAFKVKVIEPYNNLLNIVYKTVLFKNGQGIKFTKQIHEHITHSNLSVGNADFISIFHFGNVDKTKEELESKNNKYILKLQKIIKDNPKLSDIFFYYYHLGNAYNNISDYKEALRAYYNAFKSYNKSNLKKKDSFFASIIVDIIRNLIFYQEKYEQAQEFINELVSIAPNFPDIYFYQALVLQKSEKFKEAILNYDKANSLLSKPQNNTDDLSLASLSDFYYYTFMFNRGRCYLALNDLDKAFFCFKKAYNSNINLIEAKKMIFILYILEKDLFNALSYYKFEDSKNITKVEIDRLLEISYLPKNDIRYLNSLISLLEVFSGENTYFNKTEKSLLAKYLNIIKSENTNILTVLIVKNAEKYIEDSINKISSFSSQIIVIDKGSEDKTLELSSKNALVIENKSQNQNWELKNYVMDNFKSDFILFLEEDEYISFSNKDNLIQFLKYYQEDKALVFSMKKNKHSKV
ncbi:MAG: glycosyltransferase, partial [Candidatus Sericytochromatia bacterium]